MRAALCLEWIGERQDAEMRLARWKLDAVSPGLGRHMVGGMPSRKPWIAEIVGLNPKWGYQRKFLNGQIQRQRGNCQATRGVELWFYPEAGKIYETKAYASWSRHERYFFTVSQNGETERVSEEWVRRILT